MSRASPRGFTLVEILGVVVIVAVLAGIAMSRMGRASERAITATVIADLRNLALEQELHRVRTGSYASALTGLADFGASAGVTITISLVHDGGGWAAVAQHVRLPGVRCGVFGGSAGAGAAPPATLAGTVACASVARGGPPTPEDPYETEGTKPPITIQEPGAQPSSPPR